MKKFIILSFMFLFFAGISNNANAQKAPAHTRVVITYNWHCTPNPDADLSVNFYGSDQYNVYRTFHYEGKVGSDTTKTISSYPYIRYKNAKIDIKLRGLKAWASKTVNASKNSPVDDIPVTLDIYPALSNLQSESLNTNKTN